MTLALSHPPEVRCAADLHSENPMAKKNGILRVGTSGYQYDHWKRIFYPAEIPKTGWLEFYAQHFDAVEINNTFYRLPSAGSFHQWRKKAPKGFCYALKFSRYGSHLKRLKNPAATIRRFLGRAKHLRQSLGPILVQLPPNWGVNVERLRNFLDSAPKSRRWAIEFRDPRWLSNEVYSVLERRDVALCIHDMIDDHPWRITTDWTYLRFHGRRYAGSYSPQALRGYAARIRRYLADGLDVYAFFNNDIGGHAIRNALDLKRYLSSK